MSKLVRMSLSEEQMLLDYERILCEDSFAYFLERAWPSIDPGEPFKHGWHIDAICEHAEAVRDGDIEYLIINQPPRTSKSTIVSIAFPAWIWCQSLDYAFSGIGTQFMCGTYGQKLSDEHGGKFARLIHSEWYQRLWGHKFKIIQDQVRDFKISGGGHRQGTSVDGRGTGFGGHILLLDDPHNAKETQSAVVRKKALDWYDQTLSSRYNNPNEKAFILVMQRLHVEDMTGHFLSKEIPGLVHLFLPMEYMPDRKYITVIGWEDPRTYAGELLAPDRMGHKAILEYKRELGRIGYAGQYQQSPSVEGGNIFNRDHWIAWEHVERVRRPDGSERVLVHTPPFDLIIASMDTAYEIKEVNDYSACTVWGVFSDENSIPRILLIDAWQERLVFHDLVEKVRATVKRFKVDTLLIEKKVSGISLLQELDRLMINVPCKIEDIIPAGSKEARANAIQGIFEQKYIMAPDTDWAEMVINQCSQFPNGAHDDLVDTVSQAIKYLRDTGSIETREDRQVALNRELNYNPKRPAYLEHGI